MSRLHWIEIPGRLAIMARPRADDWLEADVTEWRTSGVDLVVIPRAGITPSLAAISESLPRLCKRIAGNLQRAEG